jgi:hypothetical protein|tara:strand:+ start:386 stop:640 length:255 start_codon:yes stop_codon:yes gene_type:complete
MKLPIIKTLVSNDRLTEDHYKKASEVLQVLAQARGLKSEELDVIGELVSNIEGALVVHDDHVHFGTPLKEALNKFMQRVIKSVQ